MSKTFTKFIAFIVCLCMFNFANAQADGNITFTVDMNQYASSFDTVYLAGAFNGWSPDANPMTNNGDGTWTTTVMMMGGNQEYKFQLDKWAAQDDFAGGESCTLTTGDFTNRLVAVDGDATVDAVCFNSCDACAMQTDGMITFTVDMSQYAAMFDTVYLAGAFNGWSPDANPMTDNGDGTWTTTVMMMAGNQEYKFQLDKWAAQEDFAGGESCTLTTGDFTNRLITVDGDATVDAVCFNSCDACVTAMDGMMTFTVDMNEYTAMFDTVYLSGTFNGWSPDANPMTDNGDGTWTTTVMMMAGDQEYKFQLDKWAVQDEFVGGESCTVTNGGFTNRVVAVDGDATVDAVCFNSCDICNPPMDGMMTFTVDMNDYGSSFDTVYLAGTFNGWSPDANPMTDNGDGTWTTTVMMMAGDNQYKFQLDKWSDQDEFAGGEPCTVTDGGFTNRVVTVDGDATVDAVCFNSCDVCSGIVMVGQTLPLTFEEDNVMFQFFGFGGVDANGIIDNPDATGANTSPKVLSLTKTDGAMVWGGTSMPLVDTIDFSTTTVMELKVWSPRAGVPILLKIEDTNSPPNMDGNPSIFAEVQTTTNTANGWELLMFDMSDFGDFSTDNTYNQVIVFPDFGTMGMAETFYFDDIQLSGDVAISETELAKVKMEAFPNPVANQLNVAFDIPVAGNVTLTLVDVLGRTAQQTNLGNISAGAYNEELSVDKISSGTYVLLLRLDNQLIKTENIVVR